MDKRDQTRVPLELTTRIRLDPESPDGSTVHGLTSNISSGGAFLHAGDLIPIGTKVEMELVLPLAELKDVKGKEAQVRVSGSVVRVEESGMAVLFEGLKLLCFHEDV